jgi:hypothetical protein
VPKIIDCRSGKTIRKLEQLEPEQRSASENGLRLDTIRNTPLSFLVTEHAGESTLWRMLSTAEYEKALLKAHRQHAGVYRRVAEQLGVHPSYVSRVAAGNRKETRILRALLDELHKIQRPLR